MGLLGKLRGWLGLIDRETMRIGYPAQAVILQIRRLGGSRELGTGQEGTAEERVCVFTVRIMMDDVPPYDAQVKQWILKSLLDQLQPGKVIVAAAKVHPQDPRRVALDFKTSPLTVR